MNAGEGVEKREPSYRGGKVNWCRYPGEHNGGSLKTEDRAAIRSRNPTPGHISRRGKNSDLKRSMHPSAHSSQARRQAKRPPGEEWAKKTGRTRSGCHSAVKENATMPCAAPGVDLEMRTLAEASQRQASHDVTYTWNLKPVTQTSLIAEQKPTHTENRLAASRAEGASTRSSEPTDTHRYTHHSQPPKTYCTAQF